MNEPDIQVFGGRRSGAPRREMTVRQYASRWQVTERTVWNWIYKGAVQVERTPGGGVRIVVEPLDAENR